MNTPVKKCIVLLADGAKADVMRDLLVQGELPQIKKYIADPGTFFDAVTVFPSTTGPAYFPFLTGCSPGTCNVPGIRWFDKKEYSKGLGWPKGHRSYVGLESFFMGSDIRKGIKTVFDLVPKSYSIFNAITPRAGKRNLTRISRIWYWYYAHLTDHWSLPDQAALRKILKALDRDVQYLFTVLPGIDEYSHLAGPEHKSVFESYKWLDHAVGEIATKLRAKNEWDSTALWIVSDHGLSETDTHFCVNTFLEERNIPCYYYPLIHKRKGKLAANMMSGNGMTHVAFKNNDGWKRHTFISEIEKMYPNLIDQFLAEPAVDIILLREDESTIIAKSNRGAAKLSRHDDTINYQVLSSDPFGYEALPSQFSNQESLARTISTDYPDAPYQILELFKSERVGDVVVSAAPGFDLRVKFEHPEHHGSHGSLHTSHMKVPILTNQPFEAKLARSMDTFPTILKSLGAEIPEGIDGKVLT